MATPTLILGANNWAIEEDNILGYALGSSSNQYLPREISFTRGSDATYTDSTGVVRQACWNLLQYSEDLTNGVWGKQNTTITANSTNAPDSALTADQMFDDTSLNWHRIIYTTSVISGNAYTYSIYLKANTETAVQLNTYNIYASNSFNYANFDLQNGVVGTYANCTPSITNIGNGWYRCSITQTSVVSGTSYLYVTTTNNNPLSSDRPTYAGAGNSFYIWGAQFVQGSDALAYLRTTDRLNVPRVDSSTGTKAFLVEPQRTNSIRNSSMVGAVAGSPGTLPTTSWSSVTAGLTQTIVGTGTENGLPYIDIRFNGTASSTGVLIGLEAANGIAATVGQTWTESAYLKLIDATNNANSFALLVYERNSSAVYIGEGSSIIVPTSDLQRFTFSRAIAGATAAFVQPYIRANLTNGAIYDFTIRIAAPQMELGAYATTWVPTTSTTVTRIADSAVRTGISSLIGQSEGTVFMDVYFNQASTAGFRAFFCLEGSVPSQFSGFVVATTNNGNDISYASTNYSLTTGRHKIACTYSQTNNQRKLFVDGVLRGTSTHTNFLSTIDRVSIGCRINPFSGFATDRELSSGIFNFTTYSELLSDSELAALTTL